MSNVLENYYSAYPNNVILRDTHGNPSVFVRHYKMNSSVFNNSLPDRPHPAFMRGENVYDDSILISKYFGSYISENGTVLYSLPNAVMAKEGISTAKPKVEAFGHNVTMLTIADWAFLALLSDKIGYTGDNVRGNTYYGIDWHDKPNGGYWISTSVFSASDVGKFVTFEGWIYKLLKAHSASETLRPDTSEEHWQRIEKLGGTIGNHNYSAPYNVHTLTGSGPISWYFGNSMAGEADLMASAIVTADMRTKNGELQLVPYNQAANPGFTIDESSWRAIKPHINDNGWDFVAINTYNDTIKLAKINDNLVFVARALESSEYASSSVYKSIQYTTVEAETIPVVPAILYEYALLPLPNSTLKGTQGFRTSANGVYYMKPGSRTNQYRNDDYQDLAKISDVASNPNDVQSIRLRAGETSA